MFQEFKKWTDEEIEFLKENNMTMELREISRLLNRTVDSIQGKRRKLGLVKIIRHPKIQTGQRFERLVVTKISNKKSKYGGTYFTCKCDCGKIVEVSLTHLRTGQAKSCGCYRFDIARTMNRKEVKEVSFNTLEGSYKASARKRKLPYTLIVIDFRKLVQLKCFWCDKAPGPYNAYFNNKGKLRRVSYEDWAEQQWINVTGIDRVDNEKGYVLNNCVSCCSSCNFAKGDMGFYEWCAFIERFQLGFTKNILEKLEKSGITIPPKENLLTFSPVVVTL